MSFYALLICTLILLLPPGHCNPVLYHYTRAQTTCSWQWYWLDAIPTPTRTDEVTWIVAPTPCTGLMTSDIQETKTTPYIIHHDEWFVFAAAVWTIVELTVPPPPTQDAGDTTDSKAMKPKETEDLHITSAVKSIDSEEAKRQTEGLPTEKNKENRQVDSIEAKSSGECPFLQLNPHSSTPRGRLI